MPRYHLGALRTWLSTRLSRDTSLSRSHGNMVGLVVAPEATLVRGTEIGEYVVEERVGVGGFGEVYRAKHPVIGRAVAIKVLFAKYSQQPEAVARFVAEARAANQIAHPGIVEIFGFGELADGREYCVMELLTGATLRDVLAERGRLPLAEGLPILPGIPDA